MSVTVARVKMMPLAQNQQLTRPWLQTIIGAHACLVSQMAIAATRRLPRTKHSAQWAVAKQPIVTVGTAMLTSMSVLASPVSMAPNAQSPTMTLQYHHMTTGAPVSLGLRTETVAMMLGLLTIPKGVQ